MWMLKRCDHKRLQGTSLWCFLTFPGVVGRVKRAANEDKKKKKDKKKQKEPKGPKTTKKPKTDKKGKKKDKLTTTTLLPTTTTTTLPPTTTCEEIGTVGQVCTLKTWTENLLTFCLSVASSIANRTPHWTVHRIPVLWSWWVTHVRN